MQLGRYWSFAGPKQSDATSLAVCNASVKYEHKAEIPFMEIRLSAVGTIRDTDNQRRLRIAMKTKGITDCVSNDVSDDETR